MTRTEECDVLIVGSGAGGGTAAARLAGIRERGGRAIVAEAGPWRTRETFTMRELEMTRLYLDGGGIPVKNLDLTIAAGHCVGGSTAMYTGVTFRAPEGLIADWSRRFGLPELDEADIQSRFPRLEEEIDAHFPGREMENANNRIFRQGCEALGWPVKQFRVNIRDCEKCGFCNLGCPYGSKRGTLEVQVPQAMARGVELVPNCRIERVFDGGAEGVVSPAPPGSRPGALEPGPVRFRAKKIVLAAGVLGTPELLLRSNLEGLSPLCGKFITLHPAMISFALMEEEVAGFEGFPKLYYVDRFSDSHHYYLETAFYFPFVTAKSLPGFGETVTRFMSGYRRMTCALTLVHDEALERNRIHLENGRRVVDYALSPRSREALVHAQRSAGRIFFAAGAKEYASPIGDGRAARSERDLDRIISPEEFLSGRTVANSAHPQGGCRMGPSADEGVTDAWGRVHGHPSLVVADGSLFPGSVKVNPYLTIMAFAERVAERVERELS